MEILFGTVGKLVDLLCRTVGSYLIAVILIGALAKLILFVPAHRFYSALKNSDVYLKILADARKKKKGKADLSSKEIADLLIKSKYPVWGFLGNTIAEVVLGAVIALGPMVAADYFSMPHLLKIETLGIMLDTSPLQIWLAVAPGKFGIDFTVSLGLFLAGVILHLWHASLLNQNLILEQLKLDIVQLVLVVLAAAFLSEMFAVYWITIKILDLLHLFFVVRPVLRR